MWFLAFNSGHSSKRTLSENEHKMQIVFKMSAKREENRSRQAHLPSVIMA